MGKKIFKIIKSILNELLNIIYPFEERCIICSTEGFIGICPNCKVKIKRGNIDKEDISYGFYGGALKKLILEFKYNKNFTAGYILSQLLIEVLKENNITADFICYVPMTRKSKIKRGFNQCEIISKNISEALDIPICNCIKKVSNTKEQKTLDKNERMLNLRNAFSVIKEKEILGKDIILIDDVVTTGATIEECKKILKKSGVNKITVLTIAKSNI